MRLFHSLVAVLTLPSTCGAIGQTAYPDRPIKMIVPLAATSAVDVAARIVTQKMADNMGQQIVIINQPGASGLIGTEQVARAAPAGCTIGWFNDSLMTPPPNLPPTRPRPIPQHSAPPPPFPPRIDAPPPR